MKKIITLILIILSLSLFGQNPRLTSMGNVYGYICDDADIFTYPATINNYANKAYGYLGSVNTDDYNFGFNYELARGILGVYLNKPVNAYTNIMFDNTVNPVALDHNFQAFFGFGNLGFTFSMATDKFEDEDNDYLESASALGIGAGYSKDGLDLGINMLFPSFTKEQGDIEQTESKFMMDIDARKPFMETDNSKLMVKAGFGMYSSTYDSGIDGADEAKTGAMRLSLGAAEVLNINENNLFVAGITPFSLYTSGYEEGDYESSYSRITLPAFNFGLESHVCKWLVLRSGFEQGYYVVSQETDNGTTETSSSYYDNDFLYNMGMGFIFGNFNIDCVFNKDFLNNGPNFITGEVTPELFGEIMVEYKFK